MGRSDERGFNLKVLLILSLGHLTTDIYQSSLPAVLPFLKDKLDLSYTAAGIIVMAQHLLPRNLGVASGLMVGFAIGTGGIGVTLLGIIADHVGAPFALKAIILLPLAGLMLSMLLRYPVKKNES